MNFSAILWLAITLVLGITEAVTVSLCCIWFAVGALVAAVAALLGANFWVQLLLFVIVSLICVLALRPLAKTKLGGSEKTATNADRILGQTAVVQETIDNLAQTGAISMNGTVWTARSDTGSVIEKGSVVTILRIEGVKVFVSPAQSPSESTPSL